MTVRGGNGTEVLNVVGLLSGGKDSCYNLCHCAALGHRIVALATLSPPHGKDELDSYMYQTVGHDAVHLIAEAMELPLYRTTITGSALNQTSTYGDRLPSQVVTASSADPLHDETEDLYTLLLQVKHAHPEVTAVSVGAILSNYQRVRVEHVALRADLQILPLSFLWQRNQAELLDEMCSASMESILIKVAGAGLDQRDLGRSLLQMRPKLHRLHAMYGAHICGEGGEYETFTLDCPLFKQRIALDKVTTVTHGADSSDGVYYLKIDAAHLVPKQTNDETLDHIHLPPRLDQLSISTQAPTHAANEIGQLNLKATREMLNRASTSQRGHWFAAGGIVGKRSDKIEEEFASAFDSLRQSLDEVNLSFAQLVHINVYIASQEHFATLNKVYKAFFGVDPPSRACVSVDLLRHATTGSRIVLDAIAVRDSPSCIRKALHVQGRSHWAAANIGPYSQAVEVGGCVSIAGQIGLDAPTLQLVTSTDEQIILALQHGRRIFKAVLEEQRVSRRQGWVEGCICWLDDVSKLPLAHLVWSRQTTINEDDDEQEESWEDAWVGTGLAPADVPTLYVVLSANSLPRNAAVEWQLSACNGDINPRTDEEEDGHYCFANPKKSTGSERFGVWSCTWRILSSDRAISTFGIAYLTEIDDTVEEKLPFRSSTLCAHLADALNVRVMYTNDALLDDVRSSLVSVAMTTIPVEACYDANATPVSLAIVWQSR